MSIAIQGTLGARKISAADIQDGSKTHYSAAAARILEKVLDWFCGVDREKAVTELRGFFDESKSAGDRIQSFSTLRKMVAEPFKDNFTYEVTGVDSIKLTIDLGEGEPKSVNLKIDETHVLGKISKLFNTNQLQFDDAISAFNIDTPRIDLTLQIGAATLNRETNDVTTTLNGFCLNRTQTIGLAETLTQSVIGKLYSALRDIDDKFIVAGKDRTFRTSACQQEATGNFIVDVYVSPDYTRTGASEQEISDLMTTMGVEEMYRSPECHAQFIVGKGDSPETQYTLCTFFEITPSELMRSGNSGRK